MNIDFFRDWQKFQHKTPANLAQSRSCHVLQRLEAYRKEEIQANQTIINSQPQTEKDVLYFHDPLCIYTKGVERMTSKLIIPPKQRRMIKAASSKYLRNSNGINMDKQIEDMVEQYKQPQFSILQKPKLGNTRKKSDSRHVSNITIKMATYSPSKQILKQRSTDHLHDQNSPYSRILSIIDRAYNKKPNLGSSSFQSEQISDNSQTRDLLMKLIQNKPDPQPFKLPAII